MDKFFEKELMIIVMLSERIGKTAADVFGVPRDVALDLPEIILCGDKSLTCSGCKSLKEYSENEIKLAVSGGIISVKGEKMSIKAIGNEEIILSGRIISVNFL